MFLLNAAAGKISSETKQEKSSISNHSETKQETNTYVLGFVNETTIQRIYNHFFSHCLLFAICFSDDYLLFAFLLYAQHCLKDESELILLSGLAVESVE